MSHWPAKAILVWQLVGNKETREGHGRIEVCTDVSVSGLLLDVNVASVF